MALDRVNNRLFIGHHGNGRYDIYQLDERGLPLRRRADYSIGRTLIGRGFAFAPLGNKFLNFPTGADFDPVHQRLFVPDGTTLGPPGARILVFDVHPEKLEQLARGDFPEAIAVLGQPNFDEWDPGLGPNKVGGRGSAMIDVDNQRLFFSDGRNNRVLVWDIRPEVLESGMDASYVLGQDDLTSNESGIGPNRFAGVGRQMTFDPARNHLFVPDSRNYRVLVFDVSPDAIANGMDAFAVIGQPDFFTRTPRESLRKINPEVLELDYKHHRLFVGEQFDNRVLVFDVSPEKLHGALNPDAIAVIGQPDFETTDPAISQERMTMPRITIDSERQLAYIPDGYPAGNRINIVDISPEHMETVLTPVIDQIGHINPHYDDDFMSRSANDRVSPRYWTQGRDVAIDTVDHRLFLSDNYGHRILIFELDRLNRIQDRDAKWALGQKDVWTSEVHVSRTASSIKLPLAVEYDTSGKRLFVADTWNDRVLVFDMTPGQVSSGMEASYVLGQADFTTRDTTVAANRFYFASREGAGIYPSQSRAAELAMDRVHQRLFVTDGGHNRVLVFDVHPDRIQSGADAIAVIGQDDFTSTVEGFSASRWKLPGDLAYDEEHERLFVEAPWENRVLVFDVAPDALANGISASVVIGQDDFTSTESGLSRKKIRQPDGISYDPVNERLHVTDKGNERVLIFDARPETLRSFPEAIGVVGEIDFDATRMGPGDPRNHQDRLFDPRGSAFDAEQQRLFQSEGLNTRVTVFTFPRKDYQVDLPPRSTLQYDSLDARAARGEEPFTTDQALVSLNEAVPALGVTTHLITRPIVEEQSERESRLLISEVSLPAHDATRSLQIFYDTGNGKRLILSLANPGTRPARIELTLAERSHQVELAGGAQFYANASEMFGEARDALWVDSDEAIHITALIEIPNGRGGFVQVPAPSSAVARRLIPKTVNGAGYESSFVLLNPTDAAMSGTLALGPTNVSYSIEARSVFVHEVPDDGQPRTSSFAALPADGAMPILSSIVRAHRRDGTLRTAANWQGVEGTHFWAPVSTYPTMLRHAKIQYELDILNDGPVPATVYLDHFDVDGNRRGRYERIVPLGNKMVLDLEHTFGIGALRGALRIFADSEVGLTLLKKVTNVHGELIFSDVPLQEASDRARSRLTFPLFSNGQGHATEVVLLNPSTRATDGRLSIRNGAGEALVTILR